MVKVLEPWRMTTTSFPACRRSQRWSPILLVDLRLLSRRLEVAEHVAEVSEARLLSTI